MIIKLEIALTVFFSFAFSCRFKGRRRLPNSILSNRTIQFEGIKLLAYFSFFCSLGAASGEIATIALLAPRLALQRLWTTQLKGAKISPSCAPLIVLPCAVAH